MSKKFTTDELRAFYFSKASNYSSFRERTPDDPSPSPISAASRPKRTPTPLATPKAEAPSTPADAPAVAPPPKAAAGSAVSAARSGGGRDGASVGGTGGGAGSPVDAVSPEYIRFLRQQQDLTHFHGLIDAQLEQCVSAIQAQRQKHVDAVTEAAVLLSAVEESTGWAWKSKFDDAALARDAQLVVGKSELKYADGIPSVTDLQHAQQLLVRQRQTYLTDDEAYPAATELRSVLENGVRRLERIVKELSATQSDATPLARITDDFIVQLDALLSQPPLASILRTHNDHIAAITSKQEACMAVRDEAHDDGVMDVEERETYRLADLSEELSSAVIEKLRLLSRLRDETVVNVTVREGFANKARECAAAIEAETQEVRHRCEGDLGRLYELQRSVEASEMMMRQRTTDERAASDRRLDVIAERQQEAWNQVANLLKLIRGYEQERHVEVKKRVEDKIKDEARIIEYDAFLNVVRRNAEDYDRTMSNCDTVLQCAKLLSEYVQGGYGAMDKLLHRRIQNIDETVHDTRKTHLHVFRSLLFTLGELEYKRERKIEDIGESIQAAHIQQEMCTDSLNPGAKRFSEMKKDLLRVRDDLEMELRDIRDRQALGLEQYAPTDEALRRSGATFSHPAQELEDRRLAMRAKMVEYKAMSLGRVSSAPLQQEIEVLKRSIDDSKRIVSQSKPAIAMK